MEWITISTERRWIIEEDDEQLIHKLSVELALSPILIKLLINREMTTISEIRDFLSAGSQQYFNPFLFNDMEKAVTRIQTAINNKEKILIYGDYDADGVTSTALLLRVIATLGGECTFYIPNRFTEGYGSNNEAIEQAASEQVKLIISVDTGIAANEEAKRAAKLGIDLIITDHHEPPEVLPQAIAIINPKCIDEGYPFTGLAGVGVAFKLAHALLGRAPREYVELVALGTIADMAPLVGENRVIAINGLEQMTSTNILGLEKLIQNTGLADQKINTYHVGHIIGPRINAIGRLESSEAAVRLFLTNDIAETEQIVAELEMLNRERQQLVRTITEEALMKVETEQLNEHSVLVIADENWNSGVIGIVASQVIRRHYKPTVIFSVDEETGIAKGSARSIKGFNLYNALTEVSEHLLDFGGHPQAAGLSVATEKVEVLRKEISKLADEWLEPIDFIPYERVDALITIDEIDYDLIGMIEQLEPHGIGNPRPVFLIENATVANCQKIGNDKQHVKLLLKQDGATIEALYFNGSDDCKSLTEESKVSLIGELSLNEWRGTVKRQIIIRDLKQLV